MSKSVTIRSRAKSIQLAPTHLGSLLLPHTPIELFTRARSGPIMPDYPSSPGSPSIPNSSRTSSQIMSPTMQGLLTLDLVTWASCDNCTTTRHGGRLVGHPPCQRTWALRVPTLVSCYSGLVYIIDAPFRLQDWWICMLPHSRIGCWLYAPLYLLPGFVPHFPHADSRLSYRLSPRRVLIVYQSHSLTLLRPISSSSAELYFLSSIIISPVSFPAHVLEPLNFDPTHLS